MLPAASRFFSECDHQTPCPPIITGFFELQASSKTSESEFGSGHALAIGYAFREYVLYSKPTSSAKDENIISTGRLRCTAPGYPLVAI